MPKSDDPWAQFRIGVYRDPAARDARRVVFELVDARARAAAGSPATVVLKAGGELVVRYDPPQLGVPGLTKSDYLRKAGEMVKTRTGV